MDNLELLNGGLIVGQSFQLVVEDRHHKHSKQRALKHQNHTVQTTTEITMVIDYYCSTFSFTYRS